MSRTMQKRSALFLLAVCLLSLALLHLSLPDRHDSATPAASSVLEQSLWSFRGASGAASAPRQRSLTGSQFQNVSACLLIRDDNELLGEWIAYHYHTLRLRHLLVAMDPDSRTSPAAVLERWRNHTDLQVAIWGDADYMPASFLRDGYFIAPGRVAADSARSRWLRIPTCRRAGCAPVPRAEKVRIANHRFRQVTFLAACLAHHRAAGRGAVLHVDTDEYVVLNPRKRQGELRGIPVPSVREPDGLFRYLQQMYEDDVLYEKTNLPCLTMPRVLFGAVEDARGVAAVPVPAGGYDARRFETLRWRYHAALDDADRNGQPKVLVDVSRVPAADEMFTKLFSIHRPSKARCRTLGQVRIRDAERYPLAVAHYLGPWDRYAARNDSRRTAELYWYKADVHAGPDDAAAPWLRGFVEQVGPETARVLLADYTFSNATAGATDERGAQAQV